MNGGTLNSGRCESNGTSRNTKRERGQQDDQILDDDDVVVMVKRGNI
jgi:hypothetical protein